MSIVIDNCDKCGKVISTEIKRGCPPFEQKNLAVHCQGDAIHKKYVDGMYTQGNYCYQSHTEIKLLCKTCDQKYWDNFAKANELLQSFWKEQ